MTVDPFMKNEKKNAHSFRTEQRHKAIQQELSKARCLCVSVCVCVCVYVSASQLASTSL